MSSSAVRKKFKEATITASSGDVNYPAKFYDTVNKTVKPTEDFWYSASFNLEDTTKNTHDDIYTEAGLIDLTFSCPGGRGDSIIEACENISRSLYRIINSTSSTSGFTITKVMAPEELQVKSAIGFEVAIGLEYIFNYQIL